MELRKKNGWSQEDLASGIGFALLLLVEAAGVYLLTSAGIRKGSCEQLFQEGDYTREVKEPLFTQTYIV